MRHIIFWVEEKSSQMRIIIQDLLRCFPWDTNVTHEFDKCFLFAKEAKKFLKLTGKICTVQLNYKVTLEKVENSNIYVKIMRNWWNYNRMKDNSIPYLESVWVSDILMGFFNKFH